MTDENPSGSVEPSADAQRSTQKRFSFLELFVILLL